MARQNSNQFINIPMDMSSQKSTDIPLDLLLEDLDPLNDFLQTGIDQTPPNPSTQGAGVGRGGQFKNIEEHVTLSQLGLNQGRNFEQIYSNQSSIQQQQQQQLLYQQQQQYVQQLYQLQLQKVYQQQMQSQNIAQGQVQGQGQQILSSSPFGMVYTAQSGTLGSYGGVPQQQVVTTGDKQFMNLSSTGDNSNSFGGASSDLPPFPVEDLWDEDDDVDNNNEVIQNQQQQQSLQQQQMVRQKGTAKVDLGVKQDGKPKKRRIRSKEQQVQNKVAQQRYRERRKQKFLEMEGTVDQLQDQVDTLKIVEEKVTALQNENKDLNNLVQNYADEIVRLRNQLHEMTVTSRMDMGSNMNSNMQEQEGGIEHYDKLREDLNTSMSSIRNIMDKNQLLAAANDDNLDNLADADISREDIQQLGKELSRYVSSSMRLHSDDPYLPNKSRLLRHKDSQTDQKQSPGFKVYVPVPFKQYPNQQNTN